MRIRLRCRTRACKKAAALIHSTILVQCASCMDTDAIDVYDVSTTLHVSSAVAAKWICLPA